MSSKYPVVNVPIQVLVIFSVVVALLLWRRRVSSSRFNLPLPPGPRRLPIVGNLLDVPMQDPPVYFRDMNAQYGEVVYLDAFGQPIIILGTHEDAVELLDKRASKYSNRKFSAMADLTGISWLISVVPYGVRWRGIRRNIHQHMNAKAVTQYRPIQEREVKAFLVRLMDNPKEFSAHGRFMLGVIVMRIVYGLEVTDNDDKYMNTAEEAIAAFNLAFIPGKYLVETFPIMRFIPKWFPGAKFKRDAAGWRDSILRMRNEPWEGASQIISEGQAVRSMVSDLKDRVNAGEDEEIAKDSAASVYLGASDTTLSTLQTFFAAMANYPEVQQRAQAELDAVVGPHRLPNADDEKFLPYVSALIMECLRWRSVTPLGFAHMSMEEDEYKGYRIPKGSVVVSNVWAYSRDPRHYPDPEEFKPERFLKDGQLDPSVLDPSMIAFGYGRRICPGKHFAQTTLFMLLSSVLHTFRVSAPTDEKGNPVPVNLKMTFGVISYAEPFDCNVKPRSAAAETLIRALRDEQVITDMGVKA
ncbi:cytochrome P450 [Lentinus tigrinus ALCF2SS1-7]|uniref:Cytochrome P450 n=1 Tax=Lentinus tigrinus ALCF2SS1-6 TaxID=1328759 RepID=A0A5C2RRH3_9APHY|nr:cytochrome P450 [Lentinus tigrinus ALCF2SS1-6]RPD69166.1 cytochrome P450 [Lentinus tigrinus ALCF2SS1-7]